MVAAEPRTIRQAHYPQRGADGALPRRQHRASDQHQHARPDRGGEAIAQRRQPGDQQRRHGDSGTRAGGRGVRIRCHRRETRGAPPPPRPPPRTPPGGGQSPYGVWWWGPGRHDHPAHRALLLPARRRACRTAQSRLQLTYAATGAPPARLRPDPDGEPVEVLYWSLHTDRWSSTGPFGRTILPLDQALRFIAAEAIFWALI